jgi:hypothetical protein
MGTTLFTKVDYTLATLIQHVDLGFLGLPEIQREFVWPNTKVRDLLDSMYRGFPVGYLLLWENGAEETHRTIGSDGKAVSPHLLIVDGQQRLTSLYAVVKGKPVVRGYKPETIKIAFHPLEERFEVADAGIRKSAEYIHDISEVWNSQGGSYTFITAFISKLRDARSASQKEDGPKEVTPDEVQRIAASIGRLSDLLSYPFTALQLLASSAEEQVAEVFVRINSKGTSLNQADFILTLMSVFWDTGRTELESFCRDSCKPSEGKPSPYNHFVQPKADQLLRVSIALGFRRARLQHAYTVLRGKDLETGGFSDERREAQFLALGKAQSQVLNIQNWHDFLWCVKAAGYCRSTEVISDMALMYSYAMFLVGKRDFGVPFSDLKKLIARWYFMVSLTARYSGNTESTMEQDLARFRSLTKPEEFCETLNDIIRNTLTNDYWDITLPSELATQAARSPSLYAYYAALCVLDAKALFSTLPMRDLFSPDIHAKVSAVQRHHLYPKAYLASIGVTEQRDINQLANYAWVEWADNVAISDDPPSEYYSARMSAYTPEDQVRQRYWHALPDGWETMEYQEFLSARRRLMAKVVRDAMAKLWA